MDSETLDKLIDVLRARHEQYRVESQSFETDFGYKPAYASGAAYAYQRCIALLLDARKKHAEANGQQ